MLTLNFTFRDLFRAPRLALSLQRMWIQLVGLGIGFVIYLVLMYAGYAVSGYSLANLWQQFGLGICIFSTGLSVNWYSWTFFILGHLVLLIAFLISSTAVARAVYMSAKGNHFYSWREAYNFAFHKAGSVIFTPVSLAILLGLMLLGGLLLGFLGRIPYVGEFGIALTIVFWFVGALLVLFFALALFVSFFLVPAIVATTDEDAFEAIFQTFSLVWSQPWRLLIFSVVNCILALFSLLVFTAIAKKALVWMNGLFAFSMGKDYVHLANNAQALLQNWLLSVQPLVERLLGNLHPWFFFARPHHAVAAAELSGSSVAFSSYFFALGLLFILAWILSYGLVTFTVGQTLTYLVMRKHKDGENLLERKDREEETEEPESDEDKAGETSEKAPSNEV